MSGPKSLIFITAIFVISLYGCHIYQYSDLRQKHIQDSIKLITYLRTSWASSKVDLFFKLISQFGDKALLAGAVFFAVHWLGKTEAFAVMLAFTLGTTSLGMLKLYVAEPRPFFLSPDVIPASCKDLEYGFPSGHATVATSTFGTLLYCTSNKF